MSWAPHKPTPPKKWDHNAQFKGWNRIPKRRRSIDRYLRPGYLLGTPPHTLK